MKVTVCSFSNCIGNYTMEETLRKEVEDLRLSNMLLLARQKELLLEVGRLESELKRRNENLECMGSALEESRQQVARLQARVSKDVISPPSNSSSSYYSGTHMSKLIANDMTSTKFSATRKGVSQGSHPDVKHDSGKANGLLRQWKDPQPTPGQFVDTSALLKRGNSTSTTEGDTGSETLVGSDFSASSDDDNSVDTHTMDNRGSTKSTTTRPSLARRDFPGSSWISRSIRSLPSMRSTSGSRVWVDQDDAGPCTLPPRKMSSNNRRHGAPPIPPPLFGSSSSSSSCKGRPMMTMRRGSSSSSARTPGMDDPSSSINLHEWAKANQHPPLIPVPYRSQSLQQRQNGWWQ
eukprot:Nitzschia sp. Nitz4//scaffold53_size117307//12483//13529//NITZ4_003754-RA/size117307-processed-gene-0.2-mRNA-1//1//CDS//3329554157//7112//frame0